MANKDGNCIPKPGLRKKIPSARKTILRNGVQYDTIIETLNGKERYKEYRMLAE